MAGEKVCDQCSAFPVEPGKTICEMCEAYNELVDAEEADTPIFVEE